MKKLKTKLKKLIKLNLKVWLKKPLNGWKPTQKLVMKNMNQKENKSKNLSNLS